ncbi:hypothetical protein HDV05_007046 [Chytridiales sp. JEL 0842]|nr:hypothetical protein HDV05_007046 [Chytridiales sp. JEL 0842]
MSFLENLTNDPNQYVKYVIGAASLTAFTAMIVTIQQRTKGRMKIPMSELIDNPQARAANPKLAAYAFAGRAFFYSTGLVATGTLALTMGVAAYMGVDNLKDFSSKSREWSLKTFPSLKGKYEQDHDEVVDDAAYEFMKEVQKEMKREEEEGPYKENDFNQHIRSKLKKELGPFARG